MGYGNESKTVLLTADSNTDVAANTTKYVRILEPFTLLRMELLVTTVVDAEVTYTVTWETIVGGTSTAIGTMVTPNTTAVGKVVYKNFTAVDLAPGNVIKIVVSNSGTTGRTQIGAVGISRAEIVGNLTNMVASA